MLFLFSRLKIGAVSWKHYCQQDHNAEYKIRIVLETIYFTGMQNDMKNLNFANPQNSLPIASV
jgi:hypothetical protein